MSTISNLDSQGGKGPKYEFDVDTAFMIQFLIGGTVPGLEYSQIDWLRFQSGSLGYETDDLLLHCLNHTGVTHRVLIQVKFSLNMAERNPIFQETMQKAWKDFTNGTLFDQSLDRIYLIVNDLKTDEKRHLKTLCNWAKVKSDTADFISEANRIAVKKKYLTLFRTVLGLAKGSELSNEELFAFFRCFDMLEFDLDEAASTALNSFLAIIQHSKQDDCILLPIQIWNEVFGFVSHADNKGGSFNRTSLPSHLVSYFKPAYYASLQRRLTDISRQSIEILEAIPDRIGNVSLLRPNYLEDVVQELTEKQMAVLTGEPGTGKSIIAKQFLETIKHSENGFLLVFRADELGTINLRDYFHKLNIQLSITEIFQFFPLHTSHYIYIDALEKLTESEGIGFRQLLKVTEPFPNIKILATCRQVEFPLIRFNFLSSYSFAPVPVDVLGDEELHEIGEKLPSLAPVIQNKRLLSLLRFPKYLDFTYKAVQRATVDFQKIDEQQFVQQLWEVIIENKIVANKEGLPDRRKHQFVEVAVNRAKKMVPFVSLSSTDAYALSELEKDGVIIKSKHQQDAYAPAHDILEDWALIRHAETIYQANATPNTFFIALGEEPAMRRAYRLWTLQILRYGSPRQKTFFSTVINDTTLPSFWADESIIALLYSSYLNTFLTESTDLLLRNDWALLTRFIHVMHTACREKGKLEETNDRKYIPIGECWQQIFHFVLTHIDTLPAKHYNLILYTLNSWRPIVYNASTDTASTEAPGRIINWLLYNHYINIDPYTSKEQVKLCLQILFDCCGGVLKEVKQLLKVATPRERKDRNTAKRTIRQFDGEITELALSGLASTQLAKHCPEELLDMMKTEWYYFPPVRKESESDWEWEYRSNARSTDRNISFGVTSEFKLDCFPASAFQTPVYWLLKYHPKLATAFIIHLLNHATEAYSKAEYASSDKTVNVTLYLPDNTTVQQVGSSGLWSMFRGTGISTPYLLQSVLMALEKFLLETAEAGLAKQELLQALIAQLMTESKTIALTAVVASVAQAYPAMVGRWVVPLFSSRKLISWDITRYIGDFNPINPLPVMSDKLFWDERNVSNKLPHRLRINPGLKGFIIDYCFTIREFNPEIFALLDRLKKAAQKKDWEWKKILTEMDIREWKVTNTETADDSTRFQVEPVFKGTLKKQVEILQTQSETYVTEGQKANWLLQVNEGKKEPDYGKWCSIVGEYQQLETHSSFYHHPGTAAAIGVWFFWGTLSEEERQWCFDTVLSIARRLIAHEIKHEYLNFDISAHDDDSVMIALALLLTKAGIDANKHLLLLSDFVLAPVNYNSLWYNSFLGTFSGTVWAMEPERVSRLWTALILYAPLEKENPTTTRSHPSEQEVQEYQAKEIKLRQQFATDTLEIDMGAIDLATYSQWTLLKAVKMIPSEQCPELCVRFLLQLVDLYIEHQVNCQPKPSRFDDYRENYSEEFNPHLKNEMEDKIAKIILWNAHSTGKLLFTELMERYYDTPIIEAESKQRQGTTSLMRGILKRIIYTADKNLPDDDAEKVSHTTDCFQTIWQEYFSIILQKRSILFGELFFLNIEWNEDARHWKALNGFDSFYRRAIFLMGNIFIPAVVNLLSHIGETTLLESCLPLLWQSIRSNTTSQQLLLIPHINQLVSRVFNYHSEVLAEDSPIRTSYLQLLDKLVKEGSSDAYWIREKIISFRQRA